MSDPNRNIRISGNKGHDIDIWLRKFGGPLEACSKAYLRRVVEVGHSHNLDYINVTGFRTPREQCLAIYGNWKRHYLSGGRQKAVAWAKRVYGASRGRMLHRKYYRIFKGKWTFDEYVIDFMRRNARKASHSNGRAFDVRPFHPRVGKVLRAALGHRQGPYCRYGKGIVPEQDHYHVQLSPVTHIHFSDSEALIIDVTQP